MLFASFSFCQIPDAVISSSPIPRPSDSIPKVSHPHPYHVNYWLSGSIIVAGNVGNVLAINRIKNKPVITDAEISSLNTTDLTGLDRWALKQDPLLRDHHDRMSDDVITSTIILPFVLVLNKDIRHDWVNLLLMYAEAHAVVATIYNYSFLGPTFQNKFRPIVYYDSVPIGIRENGNNRNSFYSGHVATAAVATFMMTKIYCDFHPEIGAKKYLLYTAATLPPLAISYLRVKALKHFPSDNLVGLGVGAVCGIAIPALHRVKSDRVALGMFTTQDGGIGLSLNWRIDGEVGN
ncbi:MAG TPA: phosphatase PAP2 family protein [Chitinophagales bacterium]|nr:phosphatase PAP2 family protein [Chitinophagales bacterium]